MDEHSRKAKEERGRDKKRCPTCGHLLSARSAFGSEGYRKGDYEKWAWFTAG
jgi:hypothetical protein